MNTKRRYKTNAVNPTYLYQVDIDVESRGKIKTYRLTPGSTFTVDWSNPSKVGLHKGNYTFFYAENVNGTLLIYADWRGMRKTVRESDIKCVVQYG